jgi:uncharacterized membrane protein SirB2
MEAYIGLKHLHMTLVAISGLFFIVRGVWLLQGSLITGKMGADQSACH